MEENYGQRLKAWRTNQKLSQRALGAQLDVSQGYIGDIEAGRSEPSRNFLIKLQETFGIRADFILYGEGEPTALEIKSVQQTVPDQPARQHLNPLLLMLCGGTVTQEYAAAGIDLPRDKHFEEAVWMLNELLSRVANPEDGDELEAAMPEIEELLRKRLAERG